MLRRTSSAGFILARRAIQAVPTASHAVHALHERFTVQAVVASRHVLSLADSRGFASGPLPDDERPATGTPSDADPSTSGAGAEIPVTRVLEAPTLGGLRGVLQLIDGYAGNLWVKLVRAGVETSFDEKEFINGATDAYLAVMEKFAERDMEGLAPLVSKAVVEAFSHTWGIYDAAKQNMKFEVVELRDATIVGGGLVSDETLGAPLPLRRAALLDLKQGIGEVDLALKPQSFSLHGYSWTSGLARQLYLVIKVRFDSVETAELRDKESGKVVAMMEDRRGHTWYFAREVPTTMPVESLDSTWRLMKLE